jgi:hypothetical protein
LPDAAGLPEALADAAAVDMVDDEPVEAADAVDDGIVEVDDVSVDDGIADDEELGPPIEDVSVADVDGVGVGGGFCSPPQATMIMTVEIAASVARDVTIFMRGNLSAITCHEETKNHFLLGGICGGGELFSGPASAAGGCAGPSGGF